MWFTLLTLACSNESTEAPPAETFDATLSDLAELTARHGADVAAATDLAGVTAAEDDYAAMGGEDRDQMDRCMDAFMECGMGDGMMSGGGMMSGSMDDWHGMMGDTWDEMDAHHEAMSGCATLEACQAEEAAWQDRMEDLFDQMGHMDPAWDDDCAW